MLRFSVSSIIDDDWVLKLLRKPEDDEDRDGRLGLDSIGRSSSINVEEHCFRRNWIGSKWWWLVVGWKDYTNIYLRKEEIYN